MEPVSPAAPTLLLDPLPQPETGSTLTARELGLKRLLSNVALFSQHVVGMPLRPYQLEPANAILESVLHRRGRTFTVMMSRQAGKNELSAQLEVIALALAAGLGGDGIKASPTFRPQTLNPIERLKRRLSDAGFVGV